MSKKLIEILYENRYVWPSSQYKYLTQDKNAAVRAHMETPFLFIETWSSVSWYGNCVLPLASDWDTAIITKQEYEEYCAERKVEYTPQNISYKHTPANIKSISEMVERLENGQEFYYGSLRVYYDKQRFDDGFNPFMCGQNEITGLWCMFDKLTIREEQDWWLDKSIFPVLCDVGIPEAPNKEFSVIFGIVDDVNEEYKFLPHDAELGVRYKYARPVTIENVSKYIKRNDK